jgi:two-component system CheB/CheR fusion protein
VRTGHDFSNYKRSTIMRRIARRIQITRSNDLSDYYTYLRDKPDESQALLNDLLISVTTFFRDSDVFKALGAQVIPLLFEGKEASDSVRIWVPGCATGEEAYSVGILLLEEMSHRDIRPRVQVFGSDLDNVALAAAREARYPATIEADVSEERLRRFFTQEGDHYRVKRELREIAIFAFHSVLRDPPFSRMDIISCRNLLIYLDRGLQEQVIGTFHYALNPGGFLLVGSSETGDIRRVCSGQSIERAEFFNPLRYRAIGPAHCRGCSARVACMNTVLSRLPGWRLQAVLSARRPRIARLWK